MAIKIDIRKLYQNVQEYVGKEIIIEGWVKSNRNQNHFGFLQVTDGTFFSPLQVVYEKEKMINYSQVSKLTIASALKVTGYLVETSNAKQPFELQAQAIEIVSSAPSDYPLQPKRHTREFLREIAHFRPRSNLFQAVFRIRSLAAFAIHQFFQDKDFVYVHTPIITGSDAEGAGEMFQVTTLDHEIIKNHQNERNIYEEDFFGKQASLTVSGQLQAEVFALAFKNVYTFGPTFRAENSNTTRHAAEFWMIEPEIAFADLSVDMDYAEALIKYIVSYVKDKAMEELLFLNEFVDKTLLTRLDTLLETQFPRVKYTEAIEILQQANQNFEFPVEWGIDLSSEHEKYLTDQYFKMPIFVTDYPKEIKAFYMRNNDDNKTVSAMDLLVPGIGELIGGSAREERIEILEQKMRDVGIDKKDLWWYIDINRYGGVKHAGFGLGFERLIMYLTAVENIRDVIPFPRTTNNIEF